MQSTALKNPDVFLFEAFEALFLIKPFGHTYFIEDAGLSFFLAPQAERMTIWDRIRILYYQLRVQVISDLNYQAVIKPYQTRGGLFVPFLIEYQTGAKIALFVDDADYPSNKNLKAATWIKKRFPGIQTVILTLSRAPVVTDSDVLCLPWTMAF
jgi:hypothetical protein